MTDQSDDVDQGGVPDSDPDHIDPAGATVADDADREELEEWPARAEAGEFGADPGVEATTRIVRSLLEDADDAEE